MQVVQKVLFVMTLAVALGSAGCGYALAGRGSFLPTDIRVVGIPSRWSRSRLAIARHPPGLGEHTAEVLRESGLSDAAIRRLAAEGAIGAVALPPAPARRSARKSRRTR